MSTTQKYITHTHSCPLCLATGIRVPLPEYWQRQTFTQPGPHSYEAGHSPDGVHVLRPIPQHDQVSDFLRKRHPQCFAGVFQEDCRERTTSGNHVDLDPIPLTYFFLGADGISFVRLPHIQSSVLLRINQEAVWFLNCIFGRDFFL